MAGPTYTPNLNLIKPDPNDVIDINQINTNMNTIDTEFGRAETIAVLAPGAFCGAYPLGISMFPLVAADIVAYPPWAVSSGATSANVINFKTSNNQMVQFWFRNSLYTDGWYRSVTASTTTPWRAFSDQDYAAGNSTGDVGVLDNNWTKLNMDSVEGINGYLVDAGTGFTIKQSGVYEIEATVQWNYLAGQTTSIIYLGFGKTTDSQPATINKVGMTNSGPYQGVLNGQWTRYAQAGDTVTMWVFHQGNGAAKTFNYRRMSVKRISGNANS